MKPRAPRAAPARPRRGVLGAATTLMAATPDNPRERLTLPQIDAIFSSTRAAGGHPEDIGTWGQLGLTGLWENRPIQVYGRKSASGTYAYFKEHALFGGDYKEAVREQPDSASVVQAIAGDPAGIGYRSSGVQTVAIARSAGASFHATEPGAVQSGEHPLARFLYIYIDPPPAGPRARWCRSSCASS